MARRAASRANPKPLGPTASPKGTAKRPRRTGAAQRTPKTLILLPSDLLMPRRAKIGAPLRVVERTKRPASAPPPLWRRALQNPHELYEAYERRPIWVDDLAALFLISLGSVSLLTLLNSTPTAAILSLSDQWADFISQLFGRFGALLFSAGLIGIGVLIVLPRAGIKIHLTWRRLLAAEIAFLALLALLHLLAGDPEPRALARSGLGGGHIGWALGELMAKLFGSGLSVLIYLIAIVFAIGNIFGVRRKHLRAWGIALSKRLEQLSEALKRRAEAPRPRQARPMPAPSAPAAAPDLRQPAPLPMLTPTPSRAAQPQPSALGDQLPPESPESALTVSEPAPEVSSIPPLMPAVRTAPAPAPQAAARQAHQA
ncbi:MAG: hypothetical protein J7551_07060, partial [Chloroflexi bacterium]|nr:hypothetical protein [Chloroflexota bacterium]